MKKLLLIASALLAFTFFGCNQPDTGSSDVVEKELISAVRISPWGVLTTKTVLNSYADEPDAKIKFTFMPNESVNYNCPFLYTATDKSDVYATSKELDSFKLKEFTAKTLTTVEYKVADLITAMEDAEYLTFDAWGKVDYVQSVTVSSNSVVRIIPWGVLTTKNVLNSYADEPDAKIKFTFMPNESVNYNCPFLYTATDKSDAYATSKELDSFKLKEFTAKTLTTVEYKVADLITAMEDAEYLTFDAWGKVDYVQSVDISLE